MTTDPEVDALVADRYLDALLAAVERHTAAAAGNDTMDPDLRAAARVLRRSLVRIHPSFRFEERLASRLADLASAQAAPVLAAGGTIIPFPGAAAPLDTDPLLDAILAGDLDPTDADAVERATNGAGARRPLLVGGAALTSAAISLVGVAYVAWRASRPTAGRSNGAMARAARTARARRAASGISTIAGVTALVTASALGAAGTPGGLA